MSEWISVEDRLPSELQRVLIFAFDSQRLVAKRMKDSLTGSYVWQVCAAPWRDGGYAQHVTHWMRLPEAPDDL